MLGTGQSRQLSCPTPLVLTMRVTEVDADLARFSALEWVRLRGVVILRDGTDGDERDVLVRVAALRRQLDVVMGYFAELLWEFGAAEESLAALRSVLTAATAHSENDPRRP